MQQRRVPWISLVAICSALCILIFKSQAPLAAVPSIETTGQRDVKQPVAILYEVSGDVRTKLGDALNWNSARGKRALYAGDQVFTGSVANARIEYAGIGATLMLGPHSLVTIRNRPPSFTRFRRAFDVDSGQKSQSKKDPSTPGERAIGAAGTSSTGSASLNGPVFNSGLSLIRDIDTIPVIYPMGQVILTSRQFPAAITVRFEDTWSQVGFWGFLWRVDSTLVPVWSGYSRGSFAAIPISAPGEYTLQIVTEDEARTTQPIRINASQRTGGVVLPQWPKATAQNPVTVVLQ